MGSIKLIHDHDWIISALNDAEMLERICEDGQSFRFDYATVKQMDDSGFLLGWIVDGEITGFYWVHPFNYSILQIHAHFPKQKRQYAKHSGKAMLKWLQNNTPNQYKRFIALIPDCYKDVIGFSIREGLEHSGTMKQAAYRNGQCYDVTVLGVSREAI